MRRNILDAGDISKLCYKGGVKPALPGGGAGPPLSCPDESPAQDAQKVYQDWRDDKTRDKKYSKPGHQELSS